MTKKSFNASVLPKMRTFAARLISRGDSVLVGLSGGADSVCLLHFLQALLQKFSYFIKSPPYLCFLSSCIQLLNKFHCMGKLCVRKSL